MGSKRAQKAKKRAKRDARREARRAHQTESPVQQDVQQDEPATDELIGYVAHDGVDFLRLGGDCIIASERREMEGTAEALFPGTRVTIRALTFEQLYQAMEQEGEVFRYDDEAYARFSELAERHGKPIDAPQPEDLAAFGLRPSDPPCE